MIKHIVMWRLKDHAEGADKATNAARIIALLQSLNGRIEGLRHLEVGRNFADSEFAADLVLYSELDSREALAHYQQHPEHQAVAKLVSAMVSDRRVVDYELGDD
ncbi:MAG TPA: Dabb family protein [Spongiibacteraceae bacterium]|jgi:hypothetical protein|nr:Dabb family protein [Spongiibacteraceae bacterium]HUH36754.1 Dabb family protein [Spongiibacteraceae bacterium]